MVSTTEESFQTLPVRCVGEPAARTGSTHLATTTARYINQSINQSVYSFKEQDKKARRALTIAESTLKHNKKQLHIYSSQVSTFQMSRKVNTLQ